MSLRDRVRAAAVSLKFVAIVTTCDAYVSHIVTLCIFDKGKSILYDDISHHEDVNMPEKTNWEAKVQGMLKSELKKRGVTYAQLVEKLKAVGVEETEPNIRNKLARGKFTAVFLVQCLEAIGCLSLRLSE